MSLTAEEVQHIALLARLGLTPEELERDRTQLSHILEQFQVLQKVDTEKILLASHSTSLGNVMRDDEPSESLPKEDVLANAPNREEDYFRVRAVLDSTS